MQVIKKAALWVIGTVVTLNIILVGWLLTGPKSIPYLARYTQDQLIKALPGGQVKIEDFLLTLDYFDILGDLKNLELTLADGSQIKADNIFLDIDALGLLPGSGRRLLNIEAKNPQFISSSKEGTGVALDNVSYKERHIRELLNDFINKNYRYLKRINVMLIDTPLSIGLAEDQKLKVVVETATATVRRAKGKNHLKIQFKASLNGNDITASSEIALGEDVGLPFKAQLKGLNSPLLAQLLPNDKGGTIIANSEVVGNLSVFGALKDNLELDNLNFELKQVKGILQRRNEDFLDDILIKEANVQGRCQDNCQIFIINSIKVEGKDFIIHGHGELRDKVIEIEAHLENLPVNRLCSYWPKSVAAKAREWVEQHILLGIIDLALVKIKTSTEPEAIPEINGQIILEKASLKYMDDVPNPPVIKDINANLLIKNDNLDIEITQANILESKIESGKVVLSKLAEKDSFIDITAKVIGSAQDVAKLAIMHTDNAVDTLPILNGEAETTVKLGFVLGKDDMNLVDINLQAESQLKGVSTKVEGNEIKTQSLKATFDKTLLTISGQAKINKFNNAKIQILQDFAKPNSPRKITISTKTSWKQLKEEFDFKNEILDQNVFLTYQFEQQDQDTDKSLEKMIKMDLTETKVNLPLLGIKKEAGVPATIQALIIEEGKELIIKSYKLNLPGLNSIGNGKLTTAGKNVNLELLNSTETKLHNSNFKFIYTPNKLAIKGRDLDLSQVEIPQTARDESTEKIKKELNAFESLQQEFIFTTDVKKILLKEGVILYSPTVDVRCRLGACHKVLIKGELEARKTGADQPNTMVINLNRPGELKITSNDAGKMLKGLGLYNRVSEGGIEIVGKFDKEGRLEANMNMKKFYVRKAPLLAKLLSITSVGSNFFLGFVDILNNKGLSFNELECPLTFSGGTIQLKDCFMRGSSLAMTGAGYLNFETGQMMIKGDVIPSNIVNTVAKFVPFITRRALREEKEGFLSAKYRMEGPITDAKIHVNPLGLLAPNIIGKSRTTKGQTSKDQEE
jgi:hypothetical protein